MVVRYRPGAKGPNSGSFRKKDGRAHNGRPKGSPNRVPLALKEAILEAMRLMGGKKQELVEFWVRVFKKDITLAVRLAEKILPLQITGPKDGPVQVLSIPPEALRGLPTEYLQVFEKILAHIEGNPGAIPPEQIPGDADAYAKAIGVGRTKH